MDISPGSKRHIYSSFLNRNIASLKQRSMCQISTRNSSHCPLVYLNGGPAYPATGEKLSLRSSDQNTSSYINMQCILCTPDPQILVYLNGGPAYPATGHFQFPGVLIRAPHQYAPLIHKSFLIIHPMTTRFTKYPAHANIAKTIVCIPDVFLTRVHFTGPVFGAHWSGPFMVLYLYSSFFPSFIPYFSQLFPFFVFFSP